MTTLRLTGFSGEVPRLIPRLLADGFAQAAYNTRLDDGGLTPVRLPRHVTHLPIEEYPENIGTIFAYGETWLAWEGLVHVLRGPVAQERLYIFGDGKPKIRVEDDEYDLAILPPDTGLTATLEGSATSDLVSTRLYVYTLVSDMGEETEPSPVSNSVDWFPGQTVKLSGFVATSPNRTITHQRIYRSATGTSGGSDFYLLEERAASTDDFTDDYSPEDFQERLPSRNWNPPPDDLKGAIALPNGMMAAFVGKDLYLCEPWRPHAWPEIYVQTTDFDIVGLGAYGNTIVVTTKGNPYIVTGSTPESMTMEKLELNLPCINARGIQDLGYTVVYPSHEGLVTVSNGSAAVTTTSLMSRDGWQAMNPVSMVSGQFNSRYFSTYDYTDDRLNRHTGTLIFDFTGEQPFIIRWDSTPSAYFYDITQGKLFFLLDRDVFEYDAPGQVNAMQFWRSKEFALPRPVNFGAILVEVDGDLTEAELAALEAQREAVIEENETLMSMPSIGGELNGSMINQYALDDDALKEIPKLNRTVSVQVYADGKLAASVSRYNSMDRLPSGFMPMRWSISVSSDMPVSQITMATTGAELMDV
ncbi:MAG TPA: hypothetical protein VNQ97_05680 [Burkholderiaceae bacterium]|nr:hypothetical protein [Burkholderiaceae bacterium]